MRQSRLAKLSFVTRNAIRSPWWAFYLLYRGFRQKDRIYTAASSWVEGALKRVPLDKLCPGIGKVDVVLPRALDREWMISITAEEICCLCAIEKWLNVTRMLEIGTWDGNTALSLAANAGPDGIVVTVDLPSDFDLQAQKESLTFTDGTINLTDRGKLGRQFHNHALNTRIRQVYGDSAAMDWRTLWGPFDLVFIDGCHSAAYVESDTKNALMHLRPGGAIVWHDYAYIEDVSLVVDRIATSRGDLQVHAVDGVAWRWACLTAEGKKHSLRD